VGEYRARSILALAWGDRLPRRWGLATRLVWGV